MFDFIKENPFFSLFIFLLIVAPSFLFGAVQVVFYIVIGVIVFALVGGMILRWRLRKMVRDAQSNAQQQQQQYRQGEYRGESSRQRSSYSATANKRVSDDVGEYVDFEEVEDK